MKKTVFISALVSVLLMVSGLFSKADAQLSTLYGERPNQYTSKDTFSNSGVRTKTFKFTDLVKQSLTYQLDVDSISGNGGGYWDILASVNGGVKYGLVASIPITKADSSYLYTIPYINPYTYYKSVIRDTGNTKSYSYQIFTFYR